MALYCICKSNFIDTFMIACDKCEEWFHGDCIGVDKGAAEEIDKFYCPICIAANSHLKITYKPFSNLEQKRKKKARKPNKRKLTHSKTSHPNKKDVVDSQLANTPNEGNLTFNPHTDTTHRRAKTIACKNIKLIQDGNIPPVDQIKRKSSRIVRQCYGPGCTKAARKDSKYCGDDCGIKLGIHRIREILPQRLQQRKALSSAADEQSKRNLTRIRQQQKEIEWHLEQLEARIAKLLRMVEQSKTSACVEATDDCEEENSAFDCRLCGVEVATKMAIKHMESCYKKQERRLLLTGTSSRPDDSQWNIFCNAQMGKQGYCKQLRVLCPLHFKSARNEEDLCGYPLECGKFCGRQKKNCFQHPNCWEDLFRAELDLEKLKLLTKLSELEKEEMSIRENMAMRGNLLSLLLHQTIVH